MCLIALSAVFEAPLMALAICAFVMCYMTILILCAAAELGALPAVAAGHLGAAGACDSQRRHPRCLTITAEHHCVRHEALHSMLPKCMLPLRDTC